MRRMVVLGERVSDFGEGVGDGMVVVHGVAFGAQLAPRSLLGEGQPGLTAYVMPQPGAETASSRTTSPGLVAFTILPLPT